MYHYTAKLVRVIDGDTVVLDVDLGFAVTVRETFRLAGINAPEVRGIDREQGLSAASFLHEMIGGSPVEIFTLKDKQEKYGRYLATLAIGATNINAEMVKCGFAEEYKP